MVSALLVHSAGTWAYAFFIIIRQGEVAFYEPNKLVLMAEFGIALLMTLAGIFFLGMAIWETGRKMVEK